MAKKSRQDKSEADMENIRRRRKQGGEIIPVKVKRKKYDKALVEERDPGAELESEEKKSHTIVSDIIQFWNAGVTSLRPDWTRAEKNIDLVFGEHFDKEEQSKHFIAGRTPLNMPGLFAKVMTLSGWEKNNREQFECEAKGKEDELTAEIMNWVFRHIENNDDPKKYEYTKTDVFNDGIVPFCGVDEIYVETDDLGQSEIKIRHIPYNEVVFERNFTDVEMTGCGRVQHGQEKYTDELKIEYPLKAKEIDGIPSEYLEQEDINQDVKDQQQLIDAAQPKRKRVRKIRDWKLINKVVYRVHCIKDDIVEEYWEEAEAKSKLEEKKNAKRQELKQAVQGMAQLANGAAQLGPEGVMAFNSMSAGMPQSEEEIEQYLAEDYILQEVPKRVVEYTVIAGNLILEEPNVLDVDEIPLTFYFSIFFHGRILTIIDICKHLQQYFDKLFSQLDKNIGEDTKTSKAVYTELIDEEYQTVEEAMEALSNGENIAMKGLPGQGNAIQVIQRSGTSPEYFTIFEMILQLMEDAFGGRNFQGAQEAGGQSGKAIAKLQAAAALIALNYMDNLRRHDMQVGRKLVKYIKKYYTHKFAVKVLGEKLTEEVMNLLAENKLYEQSLTNSGMGWIAVNDSDNEKSRPLSEANLSIVVNRVNTRQDEQDVVFEKLSIIQGQGVVVPPDVWLDTVGLKASQKQKIIKANEEAQEIKMRQMAMEEKKMELDANLKVAGFTKPEAVDQVAPGMNGQTGT